jgi:geranylgeranyl diphosphate synthase type II
MSSTRASRFTPEALEASLARLLPRPDAPPAKLHEAMRYAVLSGGKRFRPRLLLVVAESCGLAEADRELALRAACAVELIHCGSLVHDDLPAFDGAGQRRGRPSVHAAFGEPVALLVGTALLTRAFEILASAPSAAPQGTLAMLRRLAEATGSERGIIGGQGLEDRVDSPVAEGAPSGADARFVDHYHGLKTGALFAAAAEMGALAAARPDGAAWGEVGAALGRCHQIADDLDDVFGDPAALGKEVGVDERKHRPNVVRLAGADAARARLEALLLRVRSRACALTPDATVFLGLLDGFSQHFGRAARAAG